MRKELHSAVHYNDDYKILSKRNWNRGKYLVIMMIPVMAYYILFCYLPMVGLYMGFTQFRPGAGFSGIFSSKFVGLKWFRQFFQSPYAFRLIRNTFLLSFYSLIFGFPIPIFFAICITQIQNKTVQKSAQVLTYLPYFISTVVVVGMINNFLSPSSGIINQLIVACGGKPVNFLGQPQYFRAIYVLSGSWQSFGFNSIIFVAAIMAIPPELYEAMDVDGASKLKKVWYLVLPSISSTIILLLIMSLGNLLNVGFEKVYLLYSPGIYETADVIQTYVYRQGIENHNYGYATAVGLFNSVITFAIVFLSNRFSRKLTETSVW
ncbi:ABC transporter permease subunit [uncultured Sphaerochaeta sp.]|uniref:ABC transporter permease n=1 Tax=uncultured Sphaerochaeta sp. TaxID=886478 RepID=UPI002A0A1E91|nr:ABC transporter permease subunit [uncultured Sphaerochaeta sp.]